LKTASPASQVRPTLTCSGWTGPTGPGRYGHLVQYRKLPSVTDLLISRAAELRQTSAGVLERTFPMGVGSQSSQQTCTSPLGLTWKTWNGTWHVIMASTTPTGSPGRPVVV